MNKARRCRGIGHASPFRSGNMELHRGSTRRLFLAAQASVLILCLWGCSQVQERPFAESADPKPPSVPAAQAVTDAGQGSPFDELKKLMTPRRTKLAIAGGAALLVVIVVGVGIGRILKGTPPAPAEPPRDERVARRTLEVVGRSRSG